MNIITRALYLADAAVALAKVSTTRADDIKLYDKALAAIREALANHFEQNLTMVADHSGDANEMVAEPKCSEHPDAPHGFDRNASHNAGRYVCECEGWEPDDMTYQPNGLSMDTQDQYEVGSLEDAEKFALNRMKQEPVAWMNTNGAVNKLREAGWSINAAQLDAKAIRAEALEEAAKVCSDKIKNGQVSECQHRYNFAYDDCAAAIRGLK